MTVPGSSAALMADDMRVDDLRYAPNVRRLVGRTGLTFENSFSPDPLCCPAHKYSDGERELYDLQRDPNEMDNVAAAPGYRSVVRSLDRVWRRRKDCDGAACQTPMPASLQASPAQERRLSNGYWSAVEARYDEPW